MHTQCILGSHRTYLFESKKIHVIILCLYMISIFESESDEQTIRRLG